MKTNVTSHSRQSARAGSAVFRAAQLFIIGLIGWLLFVSPGDIAWKADSLALVLALAALVGITWYLARARAERRWRASLDVYVERQLAKEQAKRTHLRRNFHARPQSQDRRTNCSA
jgi:GAF domain-containing protein